METNTCLTVHLVLDNCADHEETHYSFNLGNTNKCFHGRVSTPAAASGGKRGGGVEVTWQCEVMLGESRGGMRMVRGVHLGAAQALRRITVPGMRISWCVLAEIRPWRTNFVWRCFLVARIICNCIDIYFHVLTE